MTTTSKTQIRNLWRVLSVQNPSADWALLMVRLAFHVRMPASAVAQMIA